ncbi:hypothetical protein VTK56DRAFT_224 [Thermocarpiscus australiensis]
MYAMCEVAISMFSVEMAVQSAPDRSSIGKAGLLVATVNARRYFLVEAAEECGAPSRSSLASSGDCHPSLLVKQVPGDDFTLIVNLSFLAGGVTQRNRTLVHDKVCKVADNAGQYGTAGSLALAAVVAAARHFFCRWFQIGTLHPSFSSAARCLPFSSYLVLYLIGASALGCCS